MLEILSTNLEITNLQVLSLTEKYLIHPEIIIHTKHLKHSCLKKKKTLNIAIIHLSSKKKKKSYTSFHKMTLNSIGKVKQSLITVIFPPYANIFIPATYSEKTIF